MDVLATMNEALLRYLMPQDACYVFSCLVLASLLVWLAFHCANLRATLPHPDIYCHPSKVSVTLDFGLRHLEWINLPDFSNLYCWTASTLNLE